MSARRAFALLPLLLLASLCLALALLCASTAGLAGASASTSNRRLRCQLGALAAARLGCGVLAQAMGPDQRWSGTDAEGVVWAARRQRVEGQSEVIWDRQLLAGQLRDHHQQAMSWRVIDVSCRADLAAPLIARERSVAIARKPRMRQRLASGATQPAATPATLSAAWVADLAALQAQAGQTSTTATSAGTRTLLINPATGAWRENLSCVDVFAKRLGLPLAQHLLTPVVELREQPARGMEPIEVGTGSVRLRHAPVLTDLALSLGVFNARSDGRHRVRMHVQMTLWNPAALPLLTPSDKRLFLAEIEGAPEVTVTNLDSGASFSTWLDRCPPGMFWSYTQGPRERSLWWWVEVLDSSRYGMTRSGILPGEVYALLMPDPASQPYGLSRVIGGGTWRYDASEHPPGWIRPSPEVFLPTDRIVIAVRFVTPGTTLRLHPYVGTLPATIEAAEYPSPALLTLAHVPWSDGRLELTGEEYSRFDSNGYVIGERRFSWRVRLTARSDADMFAHGKDGVLLGSTIDLADPRERQRWQLSDDPVLEARESVDDFVKSDSDVLRDTFINRHEALTDGAFSDWRFRDVPVDPPLDVAALGRLHGMTAAKWLAEIDHAFFSCPDTSSEDSVSENPRLVPWHVALSPEERLVQRERIRGPEAAQVLALEGSFNVHTTDAAAWQAWLRSDRLRWVADVGGPALPGRIDADAAFFSQPTGAMLGKFASSDPSDCDDEDLEAGNPDVRRLAMRRQSIRVLSDAGLSRFCEALVSEIRREPQPFVGLEAFFQSGVVERAIETAGLNQDIPMGSPLALDAATLFGAHSAMMVVRGDTFAVVGEARVGGLRLALELTLQRMPETAARPHLGRRLIVTKARWLD